MEQNYFLAKWLNGEIHEEELLKHISEDELRSYKKIISASNRLEAPEYNAEEAFTKLKSIQKKSNVRKLQFIRQFYKVAAVLTLFFASYYFISDTNTTYTTNLAEKTTFELPDHSNVNLNAESEIKFNPKNWKNNRELNLKGEAYFKVEKGSKFTVQTNLGKVQVLGTQFNVAVRDHYFEVNCYEGLVSVTYNNEVIKIPAGSRFKMLNSNTEFTNEHVEINPSWIKNNSNFKSMPYKFVIKELERQFNVSIKYDTKHENTLFTGSFTHTNLELALQAISIPLNLKFTIFSDKQVRLQ